MKSSPNPVGWTNDNDQNESSPMSIIERETKTQRANTNQWPEQQLLREGIPPAQLNDSLLNQQIDEVQLTTKNQQS